MKARRGAAHALIVAVVAGVLIAGASRVSLRAGVPDMPATESVQSGVRTVSWELAVRGTRVEARHEVDVTSVAPHFESVRLAYKQGSSTTVCATFESPILQDTGSERFWVYTMDQPKSGVCAQRASTQLVAIGRKGGIDSETGATRR